jgi:ubiquinone/menaquinone biosynthesis C-methylase UbiE
MGILEELLDDITPPERLEYTRRAFSMLPPMERPNILDAGCGSGQPTVELAILSNGNVVGIDLNAKDLERLEARASEAGVADRVRTVNGSYMEMEFPEGSFDLIWAEATIHVVGIEAGVRELSRFLGQGCHMVIHEMILNTSDFPKELLDIYDGFFGTMETVEGFRDIFDRCGFDEVGHFTLPEDAWEGMYFIPLFERMDELQTSYRDDPEITAELNREREQNELLRKYQEWWGSAYFIMRKR